MDMCLPQGLDSSFILYLENQPAKPESWNSAAFSISLFETNKFIEINLNNISMSLLKMADFIRTRAL